MKSCSLKYKSIGEAEVEIEAPSSKSIHNRLLILKKLYFPNLNLLNESMAGDSVLLKEIIQQPFTHTTLDALDAGTCFRFMTALLSVTTSHCVLTGTKRMKERPVKGLVDMLRQAGADITYTEKEGFPPLKIKGKALEGGVVIHSESNVSSQFFSAMAMVAPSFSKGLTLILPDNLGSKPYWQMTLDCMCQLGIPYEKQTDTRYYFPHFQPVNEHKEFKIEQDWSGASYFVLLPLLIQDLTIILKGFSLNSIQGDAAFLKKIAPQLALKLTETREGVCITKLRQNTALPERIDFKSAPDLSLNFIVMMALLRHDIVFTGLESLAVKESDRTLAIQQELQKVGVQFFNQENAWHLKTQGFSLSSTIEFSTYKDHRVAMALSYFGLFTQAIIHEPESVSKSFPDFWNQLSKTGIFCNI
ncbi:MAG: 3-phosphoshikimate 1-carboxyvinyltransferase [Bacteroidia bacterium]|nr:3-phosphoshikimate 1-carboxyvinyltransferase [Bacteroidia bacterium]